MSAARVFDSHCHLGFRSADEDPAAPELIRRARAAGVTQMLDVGIDAASSRAALGRARQHQGVHASVGLHPNAAGRLAAEWRALAAMAASDQAVAIGETGLDLYWKRATLAEQRASLERHLELAADLEKPVILHCRDAFPALFDCLAPWQGLRAILHCFIGGVAEVERCLQLGLAVSFAAPVTYPRNVALREAAARVPDERLLVETDAPFLPPHARRGERNEPAWILETVAALAQLRGSTFEGVAERTRQNACDYFGVAPVNDRGRGNDETS